MAISANSHGAFKEDTAHKNRQSAILSLFSPGLPNLSPDQLEDLGQRAHMELKVEKKVMTPQVLVSFPIQIDRQVINLHGVMDKRKTEVLRISDGSVVRTSADVDRLVNEIQQHRAKTGRSGEDDAELQTLAEHAKDQCGNTQAEPSSPRPITPEMEETFMAFINEKMPSPAPKERHGNRRANTPTKAERVQHRQASRVAEALGMQGEPTEKVRAEARARVRRGEFLVSPRPEIELDAAAQEVLRRELELRPMKQELSFDMRTKVDAVLARTPSRPATPAATQEASTPERS